MEGAGRIGQGHENSSLALVMKKEGKMTQDEERGGGTGDLEEGHDLNGREGKSRCANEKKGIPMPND